MNKIILLFILLLSLVFVDGSLVDKPLNVSVANCYSINVSVSQKSGSPSDMLFPQCSKINPEVWGCDCLNLNNDNFTIIPKTDDYPVHEERDYDISFEVYYYKLFKKDVSLSMVDFGDYYSLSDLEVYNVTKDCDIYKPVYVNNTVFIDRNVTLEKIVFRNVTFEHNNTVYVNNITYIENNTRINKLELENTISLVLIIVLAFGLLILIFMCIRLKRIING